MKRNSGIFSADSKNYMPQNNNLNNNKPKLVNIPQKIFIEEEDTLALSDCEDENCDNKFIEKNSQMIKQPFVLCSENDLDVQNVNNINKTIPNKSLVLKNKVGVSKNSNLLKNLSKIENFTKICISDFSKEEIENIFNKELTENKPTSDLSDKNGLIICNNNFNVPGPLEQKTSYKIESPQTISKQIFFFVFQDNFCSENALIIDTSQYEQSKKEKCNIAYLGSTGNFTRNQTHINTTGLNLNETNIGNLTNIKHTAQEEIKFKECIFTFIRYATKENSHISITNTETILLCEESLSHCIEIKTKMKIVFENCIFEMKKIENHNKDYLFSVKDNQCRINSNYQIFKSSVEGINLVLKNCILNGFNSIIKANLASSIDINNSLVQNFDNVGLLLTDPIKLELRNNSFSEISNLCVVIKCFQEFKDDVQSQISIVSNNFSGTRYAVHIDYRTT